MNSIEIRAHRRALGLHQAALAAILGVKQLTVSRWETGSAPIPQGAADDVLALADRLTRLTEDCKTQGRDTGTITVIDDAAHPMSAVLLVAAAHAQAALRTEGITTTITTQ